MSRLDFAAINAVALRELERLVALWLPGGKREGHEYKALNPLRGDAKIGSLSVNLHTGAWADFATDDRGGDPVSLYAWRFACSQKEAALEVAKAIGFKVDTAPSSPPAKKRSDWSPLVPVPEDALKPSFSAFHYGEPEAVWCYRDARGRTIGYVRRFKKSDGGKEILPLTWCEHSDGSRKWHAMAFPTPRPLYGLWRLREGVPVLIVEGEKCTDAGQEILSDKFDVVTWPGGAKAISKIDWQPLAGKPVLIWPDHDEPGVQAAERIAAELAQRGCTVRIVVVPEDKPAGWDVADAVQTDGWSREQVLELLRQQRPPDAKKLSTPGRARASHDDELHWQAQLVRDGKDRIVDCRENVIYVLRDHPEWRGVLAADVFAKRIVVRNESPLGQKAGAVWSENSDSALALWLWEQCGLRIRALATVTEGVRHVAALQEFHPVREWIDGLHWDGVPRVDEFPAQYLGAADTLYHRKAWRYFMIAAIQRIYEPGCVMRAVPVLEGAQNAGKSRVIRVLAQPWSSDTPFRVGDKDAYQQIRGVWIYEISELDSFSRAEASQVKAFISSPEDNFRAPYARENEKHPRQTVFMGSVNGVEWLKDWTGNTRFWPIACGDLIDVEGVMAVREQLIAEAAFLYRLGERTFPTREEALELFEPEQTKRTVQHAWAERIGEWLASPQMIGVNEVTVYKVLVDCLKIEANKMSPQGADGQLVGKIMQVLKWTKHRASEEPRPWVWRRPQKATKPETEEDVSDIPF